MADEDRSIEDGGSVVDVTGSSQAPEIVEIYGGDASGLEPDRGTVSIDDRIKKEKADMARRLAYLVIWALLLSILIHYGFVFGLELAGQSTVAEKLDDLFRIWLPVISGFAGSATTYFLTREH